MKQIPLTQGKFALVDDEDYDFLMQWKWNAKKGCDTFYAVRHSPTQDGVRSTIWMHRALTSTSTERKFVDHKDGNGLNNQRYNLRSCTHAENVRNSRRCKSNTSGYKGVTLHKDGRWAARVMFQYKRRFLGYFQNKEDAALAYDEAAKNLHGEFAKTNL